MAEATTHVASKPSEEALAQEKAALEFEQNLPHQDPWTTPLEKLHVARGYLFRDDAIWPYFERLRKEAPVHYCAESPFGPYWSVSSYDLIKQVDQSNDIFSSEPGITIFDQAEDFRLPMFIAMDQPKHDQQRNVVQPVVAPKNLANLQDVIRKRVCAILDSLPVGETFNWVDQVSIELTTQMLATLFDFPFDERYKLTRWSDVATGGPESGIVETIEQRREELIECLTYFQRLWAERQGGDGMDFVTMLTKGESTQDMDPFEFLGNLILLIVGGNDTTRNSISGGVWALNQFPEEYDKLRNDSSLIPNMVSEIIRWQTPLAHMRRRALVDTELGGQQIKAGDKVVMWYVSGNRDETVFEDANRLLIDRPNARQHLSFGFGIHRCMGNRMAEMQLRTLWEEIQKRFEFIEVVGEPERSLSAFVKGYTKLDVRLHRK